MPKFISPRYPSGKSRFKDFKRLVINGLDGISKISVNPLSEVVTYISFTNQSCMTN